MAVVTARGSEAEEALGGSSRSTAASRADVVVDPHRAFIFPNRVREHRRRTGDHRLLAFAARVPEIPYIRLSKIERGEVFARPDELRWIAKPLGVAPETLLIDVDAADFNIAHWAEPFADGKRWNPQEERFAMLLAAAIRARRALDRRLTIHSLEKDYGLAPVIISRIENAQKPIERCNDATVRAICNVLDVSDIGALRQHVEALHASGALDAHLAGLATAETRLARTRQTVVALRSALQAGHASESAGDGDARTPLPEERDAPAADLQAPAGAKVGRRVPVFGVAMGDGLIAKTAVDCEVEAPQAAGPRAFGLRVLRPTLGGGLPGQATVIVDPDRFPAAGGLAAVREEEGYRILAITLGREGELSGYSLHPNREVAIDTIAPENIAAVIAALFI